MTTQDRTVAIFIPTFGRHHKLQAVYDNVVASTQHPITVYFICEQHDTKSIQAVQEIQGARLIINTHKACYAGAINCAYEQTIEPYFFTASDDLNFHFGWLEKCMEVIA